MSEGIIFKRFGAFDDENELNAKEYESAYRRGYQQGLIAGKNGVTKEYAYWFRYHCEWSDKPLGMAAAMHESEMDHPGFIKWKKRCKRYDE